MLASIKLILLINNNLIVMLLRVFIALLLIQGFVNAQESCLNDHCSEDLNLNGETTNFTMHIIPHSHQDVGW